MAIWRKMVRGIKMHIIEFCRRNGIENIFYKTGGFRSIFDPFCSEWQDSCMEVKVYQLEQTLEHTTLSNLIEMYVSSGLKEYITQEVPFAIDRIRKYLPAAQEYWKTSSRCAFIRSMRHNQDYNQEILEHAEKMWNES